MPKPEKDLTASIAKVQQNNTTQHNTPNKNSLTIQDLKELVLLCNSTKRCVSIPQNCFRKKYIIWIMYYVTSGKNVSQSILQTKKWNTHFVCMCVCVSVSCPKWALRHLSVKQHWRSVVGMKTKHLISWCLVCNKKVQEKAKKNEESRIIVELIYKFIPK